jgi:hypothetical protein
MLERFADRVGRGTITEDEWLVLRAPICQRIREAEREIIEAFHRRGYSVKDGDLLTPGKPVWAVYEHWRVGVEDGRARTYRHR